MLGTGSGDASGDYLAPVRDISAQFFGFFIVDAGNPVHAVMTNFWAALAALSEIVIHDNSTPL
jgi:cobalamin-dependent methionine synthase I